MTVELGLASQSCQVCVYWRSATTTCHHHAPVGTGAATITAYNWEWPVTQATDWCGEWEQVPAVDRTV